MEQQYYVIIGDIINSRGYAPTRRLEIQNFLQELINTLNQRTDIQYLSHLVISQGDEIQATFFDIKAAMLVCDLVSLSLKTINVEMRFGIGYGNLITKKETESTRMDGPVFWNAREAIATVKVENYYGKVNLHYVSKSRSDASINIIIGLQELVKNSWSSSQVEFCLSILMKFGYHVPSNKEIAILLNDESEIGLRQSNYSSVSNRLKSTQIGLFCESRLHIASLTKK